MMTRMVQENKKTALRIMKAEFLQKIDPILRQIGFEKSVFSSHHFGKRGKDYTYTYINLEEPQVLELIYFNLLSDELRMAVFFNRISLDKSVGDVLEFSGMDGHSLLLMPVRATEQEIHRWVPIPFLKIPSSYKVTELSNLKSTEKSAFKTISNLADDLSHFDIIRAEWNDLHTPTHVKVENLK